MKEIKYRAWETKEKRMQYGIYPTGNNTIGSWKKMYNREEWQFSDNGGTKVKLMQFTGIRDKNGKDVYESDILGHKDKRYNSKVNMLVKYDIYYCEEYGDIIGFKFDTSLEVIGNKFENPKLYEKVNK